MSTLTTLAPAPAGPAVHPAARLSRTLRIAAASVLVLGTALQAAAWLVYAQPDLTVVYSQLASGARRPDVSLVLNILATPFWVASVAVYVLLGRLRSRRLAWVGGGLLVTGLIALATNLGTEVMTGALAQRAVIDPAQAASATRTLDSAPATVMNLLFLLGVGLGVPLTGVALWRSRAVPRSAAALLVAFLAVDLVGQSTQVSALGVAAHLLALVAASWIAVTVLTTPSPASHLT